MGVRDCLDLFRDFYFDNFGIVITNYARPSNWSSEADSLIRQMYEREGFEMISDWKLKDLRPADVLCMAIGESEPNHMAVYVGDNKVVHHLWGRLSSVDPFRDFFLSSTCFVLRHHDVPDLRPAKPDTTLGSILRDRYNLGAA